MYQANVVFSQEIVCASNGNGVYGVDGVKTATSLDTFMTFTMDLVLAQYVHAYNLYMDQCMQVFIDPCIHRPNSNHVCLEYASGTILCGAYKRTTFADLFKYGTDFFHGHNGPRITNACEFEKVCDGDTIVVMSLAFRGVCLTPKIVAPYFVHSIRSNPHFPPIFAVVQEFGVDIVDMHYADQPIFCIYAVGCKDVQWSPLLPMVAAIANRDHICIVQYRCRQCEHVHGCKCQLKHGDTWMYKMDILCKIQTKNTQCIAWHPTHSNMLAYSRVKHTPVGLSWAEKVRVYVHVYNTTTRQLQSTICLREDISCIRWSPTNPCMIYVLTKMCMRVYNIQWPLWAQHKIWFRLCRQSPRVPVRHCVFDSTNPDIIYVTHYGSAICRFNWRTRIETTLIDDGVCPGIFDVQCNPRYSNLLALRSTTAIYVYDTKSASVLCTLTRQTNAMEWSSDGTRIIVHSVLVDPDTNTATMYLWEWK